MSELETIISDDLALIEKTQRSNLLKRQLEILAVANPYHQTGESILLTYYWQIRQTWSKSAIARVRSQYKLKLNSNRGRCFFAKIVAAIELRQIGSTSNITAQSEPRKIENNLVSLFERDEFADRTKKMLHDNGSEYGDPSPKNSSNLINCNKSLLLSEDSNNSDLSEELELRRSQLKDLQEQLQQQQQQLKLAEDKLLEKEEAIAQKQIQIAKLDRFTFLLLTHRLLPPGPPLNGTQDSPAMRILGSPTTMTELRSNYRKLLAREHPDLSIYPEEVAVPRFLFVRSLYEKVAANWERLKPTAPITEKQYRKRMNATVPWQPETFWADTENQLFVTS